MFSSGKQIILRLEAEGAFFSDGSCLFANAIKINLATLRKYAPKDVPIEVLARVNAFENGTLDCTILEFNPHNRYRRESQRVDVSCITQLLLSGTDTPRLLRLTDTGARTKDTGSLGYTSRRPASFFQPNPESSLPDHPAAVAEPDTVYVREFEFPFYNMRIAEGAAFFKSWLPVPGTLKAVELEMQVENSFLQPEFDSIKQYLKNFLKVKSVKVTATIRCHGSEVVSVDAASTEVAAITSDLLDTVRYWYIKRELRATEEKDGLVTVDELFEKERGSGLQPTDRQFINDLLMIKRLKHSEHMQHLSGLHLCDLMKLHIQKKPVAFVCLVSGKAGCFFALETLDKTDATYLWQIPASEVELRKNIRLIREAFLPVEQDISLIRDQGRNPYRNNPPDNFFFVRHDYASPEGFAAWKTELHQVLNGGRRPER